jgi:hypothetical protein
MKIVRQMPTPNTGHVIILIISSLKIVRTEGICLPLLDRYKAQTRLWNLRY